MAIEAPSRQTNLRAVSDVDHRPRCQAKGVGTLGSNRPGPGV